MNFIVIRHSPDWESFDLESSRGFCLSVGLPESTIVDFAAIWDRCLALTYREFRYHLKKIALENFKAVEGATTLEQADFAIEALEDNALIAFVDDDDLYHPQVFSFAREHNASEGYIWGSVLFSPMILLVDHDRPDTTLFIRQIEPFCYTNNYCVSGSRLRRGTIAEFLEHGAAQSVLEGGAFHPQIVARHLSCTNKSPASVTAAVTLNSSEDFRSNPRLQFERIFKKIITFRLNGELSWMDRFLSQYQMLVAQTARNLF